MNRSDVHFNVVRESDRQRCARFRLVHQVSAALQVQSQFQTQRAGFGSVQPGQPGYRDVDFREGQGNGRYAQDDQYQYGQQYGAPSHFP